MNNFTTIKGVSPFDLVLALGYGALGIIESATYQGLADTWCNDLLLYPAVILIVLGTFFRRLHPVPAGVAVYAGALLRYLALPYSVWLMDTAVLFALYAVVAYSRKSGRWPVVPAVAGASFGAFLLTLPALRAEFGLVTALVAIIASQIAVVATTTGALFRRQHFARMEHLINEAEQSQRNLEHEAKLTVVGERTRIAREMHDIVAHTLSVVVAQADGGRYAARSNPEAAERALTVIADMSRAALGDIRSIIGMLRDPTDPSVPLAPEPIDSDLTELIDHVRDSGREVSFLVTGSARPLPVGVGNALYRICQEALTNAMKHAGSQASLTVALHWRPAEVILDVSDNGRGAAARNDGKGHGLIGMSERAAVFGGTVVAVPRQGGGFKVTATIPTPTERTPHV